MTKRFAGWMPLALLPLVPGCAGSEDSPVWVVRDSAAVRVVENLRPAWGPDDAWRVADAPALEIGVEEGEDPYLLHRAFDALRLGDGRIVVSNSGTGELRFFDPQGVFLYSAGRHGQGPGEFGDFSTIRIWIAQRNILVATDGANGRLNLFRTSGEFATSVRIEAVPGRRPANAIDGFGDGTWLGVTTSGALVGAPGEIIQGNWQYSRYNSNGEPADVLFELADRPRYVHTLGDITHYPFIPLTVRPSVAAGALWLFVGDGSLHRIERRRLEGSLNSIIRWPAEARRRSDDVYDRFRREELRSASNERDRQLYSHYLELDLPIPEYVPSYRGLLVDDDGYLWVEQYRLPWEDKPNWEVFDPDGRWLGDLSTPVGFRPFEIGSDYVLGRHRDELGVERIRIYELIKPERL